MDNKGKFKVGTKFVGLNNGAEMEVLGFFDKYAFDFWGDKVKVEPKAPTNTNVEIKELSTGRIFHYGLQALEHCNVHILN